MPEVLVDIPEFRALRGWQWQLRRLRLLAGSPPEVTRLKYPDAILRFNRDIDPELLLSAFQQHEISCRKGQLLKDDIKRRLSIVRIAGRSIAVKEFRRVFRLGCFSPDQRSWLGAMRLEGSCRCLGWLRRKPPLSSFLFFADAGEEDLLLPRGAALVPQARELFTAAGRIIGRLHAIQVYHADCKASNFVYQKQTEQKLRLNLIDCDDIRVYGRLPTCKKARNLAQFLGGHWRIADFAFRLELSRAFLQGYQDTSGQSADRLKSFFPDILKCSNRLYPEQAGRMAELLSRLQDSPGF